MRPTALRLAFGLIFAIEAAGLKGTDSPSPALVFAQVPYRAEFHGRKPGGFLLNRAVERGGRIALLERDGKIRVLTPEFAAATDPSVLYDGKKILFAGKSKPGDSWNVWEMDADGSNKRQLTRNHGNCREPEYLATSSITPPDFTDKVRWIVFVSDASGALEEGGTEPATSLYVTNIEPIQGRGTVVWRATFNMSSDFAPTVLADGRTVFTSRDSGSGTRSTTAEYPLLASNWDGSGLNLFTNDGPGNPFRTMAVELPNRSLAFIEADSASALGGRLAAVSFKRPLHSHVVLGREGYYLYPHPGADGRLLVSWSSGRESFGIFEFDPAAGKFGRKLVDDPAWEDLDVQPLASRPEPQGLISAVVDSLDWGDLQCLSVYESDRPEVQRIPRGSVKRVRLLTGAPDRVRPERQATVPPGSVKMHVLGEAPVEPDGSFFVRVPGDTPFRIEMLDGEGKVVGSMSRWIWVRRGTSRGCIGCHENKELAPPNRVSDALKRGNPHVLMSSH
jgi:Hydrazine synthase alpha subunit middle domain